jgi:hypothetical protein
VPYFRIFLKKFPELQNLHHIFILAVRILHHILHQPQNLKKMKKGILLIAIAMLVTSGVKAQDQLRTHLKTHDKDQTMARDKDQIHTPTADMLADQDKIQDRKRDQLQDPDKDKLQTRKKDQIHQTDADIQADQDKDQLRTRKKDQLQDPDKDQLKTQDRIRLHTNVSAKPASATGGAMKNAGATGARGAQSASGAATRAKTGTRSGMGPKR